MFKDEINRLEAEMTQLELQDARIRLFLKDVEEEIGGVTVSVNDLQRNLDGLIATIYELEWAIQDLSEKMRHNENQENIILYSELVRKQDSKQTMKNDIESQLTNQSNRILELEGEQAASFNRLEINNIRSGQIEAELSILREEQELYEEQTGTRSYSYRL